MKTGTIPVYCFDWHIEESPSQREILRKPLSPYLQFDVTPWDGAHLELPRWKIMETPLVFYLFPPPLDQWWYYGLEHGQHVSFYSRETFQFIAQKHGLEFLYSDGVMHLMGRKHIHPLKIRIAIKPHFGLVRRILSSRPPASLLEKDFQEITGHSLGRTVSPNLPKE